MPVSTSNFAELLEPGLRTIFGMSYNEWPQEYSRIFEVRDSTKSTEHTLSMAGFGLVPVKPQGQGVAYQDPIQGYKQSLTHVAYGLGFIVTKEMYEDDLYGEIRALPRALAMSGTQTVEIVAANVLNRAFNSSYTGRDSLALCHTAHTLENGGTLKNKPTTDADLSLTSFEQAMIDIGDFVNGSGLKIAALPKKLIHTTANERTVKELLESELTPETANNAINVYRNKVIPELNHYLTDPDAWFIQTNVPEGLVFYWRRRPDFTRDNDTDSQNAKFLQTFRFICGWDDFRNIYGSSGA
jgi:hypothetical protein